MSHARGVSRSKLWIGRSRMLAHNVAYHIMKYLKLRLHVYYNFHSFGELILTFLRFWCQSGSIINKQLTDCMESGVEKSIPPCKRNPHGSLGDCLLKVNAKVSDPGFILLDVVNFSHQRYCASSVAVRFLIGSLHTARYPSYDVTGTCMLLEFAARGRGIKAV